MLNRQLVERLNEADVRVEKIVSLSLEPDLFALSDWADDLANDPDQLLRDGAITGDIPNLDEVSEVAEWLRDAGYDGFFVHCATPKPRANKDKSGKVVSLNVSWGFCMLRWFYSPDLEKALTSAAEWAEAQRKAAWEPTEVPC